MSKGKVDEEKKANLSVVGDVSDGAGVEHAEIRQKILKLLEETENKTWDLGVALEMAYTNDMYRSWGFDSWRKYVEEELQIQMRKAQYLLVLQGWFKGMPQNIQDWIRSMGWTKARMLMHVVTVENAAEWRDKVDGKTVAEIDKMLKEAKEAADLEGGEGGEGSASEEQSTSKNFKLFPAQLENVDRALEKAMETSGSDKPGNNLDLICTQYLATEIGIDSIQAHLKAQERLLGVRLVAYSEEEDAIVYGSDLVYDMQEAENKNSEDVDDGNAEYEA